MKKSVFNLFASIALLGVVACADVPELPYPVPTDDDDPATAGSLPFNSNSLSDFTVQTIVGTPWSLGNTYAKASGYADGATTATQTWLVSPALNTTMSGTEGIVINFQYVLRYVKSTADVKTNHRLLASTDYDGDVTTATWTDLGFVPVESATQDWTFYAATPVALPETFWNEEQVYIAYYFACDDTNSTTWEVKELTIAEGKADAPVTPDDNDDNDDPVTPDDGTYTVAQVIAAGNPGSKAWVVGYIVGTVKSGSQTYSDATFSTADASNTNLLLADDAACTDASQCIPVQLPSGSVRSGLNLQDNPGNYGRLVYLYGSLEKYFGQPGLKSVTEYSFEGADTDDDDDPTGGDDPASLPYTADFTKGACNFEAHDVSLGGELAYVWAQSASYGWKGSAYKNGNQAADSWLVSPAINLAGAAAPVLTVNHALNYLSGAAPADFVSICASTDYAGDVSTATWSALTVPTWPSGADWTFVDSGDISLAAYAGSTVTIALHYTSTTATAPTWEVKSFSVK